MPTAVGVGISPVFTERSDAGGLPPDPPVSNGLLLETGDFILLEAGDILLQE